MSQSALRTFAAGLLLGLAAWTWAGERVQVPAPGGRTIHAYVAAPAGPGPFPVVVLLHGTAGFTEPVYSRYADLFAQQGFLAVTGCWFEGNHLPPGMPAPPAAPCPGGPVFDGANLDTMKDAAALVKYALRLPQADRDRLGLWGHSRGATIALLLATSDLPVKAVYSAAAIYAYPKRGGAYRDDFPIKFIDKLSAPVMLLHGDRDPIIPFDEAKEFEAAMRAAGRPVFTRYLPGENHGTIIMPPTEEKALHAVEFFRAHLVSAGGIPNK